MNSEKHKKNDLEQWLLGEEAMVPTTQRSSRLAAGAVKIGRPSVRRSPKVQGQLPSARPQAPAVTPMREPGGSAIVDQPTSQRASWDHLQKLKHLGRMRASFEYMTIQPAPAKSVPKVKPAPAARAKQKPVLIKKQRSGGAAG